MNEKEKYTEIPSGITPEGEEIFERLFGIPFKAAQDLAKWEGEIGERYRAIFTYIKHYKEEHESKIQSKHEGSEGSS